MLILLKTDFQHCPHQMEGSAIEAQAASLTSSATSDSETSSLVETWTLVEKDEAEHVRSFHWSALVAMIDKKALLEKKLFLGDH